MIIVAIMMTTTTMTMMMIATIMMTMLMMMTTATMMGINHEIHLWINRLTNTASSPHLLAQHLLSEHFYWVLFFWGRYTQKGKIVVCFCRFWFIIHDNLYLYLFAHQSTDIRQGKVSRHHQIPISSSLWFSSEVIKTLIIITCLLIKA